MIAVKRHHVANAIRAKEANDFWAVYGGTVAWTDENNPPAPAVTVMNVDTPIGAKVALAKWVQPDDAGTIVFQTPSGTSKWSEVLNITDVITNGVHWMLLTAIIDDDLPFTTFREFGFYSALVPAPGHESDTFLVPANIASYGRLETIEYITPTPRQAWVSNVLQVIIEFYCERWVQPLWLRMRRTVSGCTDNCSASVVAETDPMVCKTSLACSSVSLLLPARLPRAVIPSRSLSLVFLCVVPA